MTNRTIKMRNNTNYTKANNNITSTSRTHKAHIAPQIRYSCFSSVLLKMTRYGHLLKSPRRVDPNRDPKHSTLWRCYHFLSSQYQPQVFWVFFSYILGANFWLFLCGDVPVIRALFQMVVTQLSN